MKRWEATFLSREDRYELGRDRKTGDYYAAIPVTSGVVDYYEYYRLTSKQYEELMKDSEAAVSFIDACRRRECDDLLLQKPGWNRGTPM